MNGKKAKALRAIARQECNPRAGKGGKVVSFKSKDGKVRKFVQEAWDSKSFKGVYNELKKVNHG